MVVAVGMAGMISRREGSRSGLVRDQRPGLSPLDPLWVRGLSPQRRSERQGSATTTVPLCPIPIHMRLLTPILLTSLLACGNAPKDSAVSAQQGDTPGMSFDDLSATDINGKPFSMAQLKGHKVMVVNTASKCGFTPQYKQLEELYERYKDKGFIIIGFPSNDFGRQEPGNEQEIAAFCEKNYGVTFPMMSKIKTKGDGQSPVYAWLTQKKQNGVLDSEVKWNFQKYLIDEQGRLVTMLPSAEVPLSPTVLNWLDGRK
jgi:glutathione peroxidase